MRVLGIFVGVCVLMLGVVAWYVAGMRSAPAIPRSVTAPVRPPPPPVATAVMPPREELPTMQPAVSWANDPDTQDAWRRLERAQQVLREDPYHALALRDKAAAAAALRLWPELAGALARLVELNPDDVGLRFERATALIRLRQWLDAIAELKFVVEQQPGHGKAWFDLAVAHQALGHLADARQAWDRAIEIAPSAEALARRGEVLLDLRDWAPAADDFAAVVAHQPDAADAVLNWALALAKLGRPAEAHRRMLAFLDTHPKHVPTLNRLAELAYAACMGGAVEDRTACEEAAEWCRRSLAVDPQQPDVRALLERTLPGSGH